MYSERPRNTLSPQPSPCCGIRWDRVHYSVHPTPLCRTPRPAPTGPNGRLCPHQRHTATPRPSHFSAERAALRRCWCGWGRGIFWRVESAAGMRPHARCLAEGSPLCAAPSVPPHDTEKNYIRCQARWTFNFVFQRTIFKRIGFVFFCVHPPPAE